MNPEQIPVVKFVSRFGIEDRVLAVFMIAGPGVILLLALVGRTTITVAGATIYIVSFILYIAYKGIVIAGG